MTTTEGSAGLLLGGNQDFSTEFYLTQFKITPCVATYPHNWSLCPFVHPNEKARRRDPRVYTYQPVPCPDDRKGINCPRKDSCQFTHNVYEYWLHPKQFRTQLCHLMSSRGTACTRPICFFAHRVSEIRYPDKEEGGGMPPLAATAQQQGQQQQQQPGSQAAGAAVRPAVGQLDQAALQQQVVQQVQQGQQQAHQQAQLQQMTLQLQQLQMTQGTPAAGSALLSAVPNSSQQQYLIGGQFAGGYGGLATGTPSHGSGGGLSQSSISGGVPLNAGSSSYQTQGQGYAASMQSYPQQFQQLPQVAPQLQQQYPLTPYAQQQYAQQLQQPYPHPAYQQ